MDKKNKTLTGKGIGVAILDTGIFPHMDFGDQIIAFRDFVQHKSNAYDDNGHGTHVDCWKHDIFAESIWRILLTTLLKTTYSIHEVVLLKRKIIVNQVYQTEDMDRRMQRIKKIMIQAIKRKKYYKS